LNFASSCRLRANASISKVAQLADTGTSQIENHYAHVYDEM